MSRANPRFRRTNAPLPVATNPVWLISVLGTLDNQQVVTTFGYYSQANTLTAASEGNIGASWLTNCKTTFLACCSAEYLMTGVKVQCVSTPSRSPVTNFVNPATSVGTGGVNHLPSTVAGIFSKYTSVKGQHGRGRSYMPAIPAGFVTPATDPNRLNAAGINAYQALSVNLLAAVVDGATNVSLAIFTRVPKGGAVTQAANCLTCQTRPLLGTVRRRRIGRGK